MTLWTIQQPFDEDKGAGGTLAWEERRGTPSYELEDLEYYANGFNIHLEVHVSFSSDQGFIQGLEELFMHHVLKPWVLSSNCGCSGLYAVADAALLGGLRARRQNS